MALAVWETKVRDRVRRGVRKYGKLFAGAKEQRKGEADLSNLVYSMLHEVFGYDSVSEITAEYRIRAQLADYAVKLGGKPIFLIETKAPAVKLTPNHLWQVSNYAMQKGLEWVVLTNGCVWQVFHISRTIPVTEDAVFECDLSAGPTAETVERLCCLTREYVVRGEPRKTYERVLAVRPANILRSLYSESVLAELRRNLRSSTGYKADIDELRDLIDRQLLRPELVGKVKLPRKTKRAAAAAKEARAEAAPVP